MKTAIYCRVSSEMQVEDETPIAGQLEECQIHALRLPVESQYPCPSRTRLPSSLLFEMRQNVNMSYFR